MANTEKDQKAIEIARGLNSIPWCEDYEKMISGMLYNSLVPELEQRRFQARKWCHQYNNWFPHDDPNASFETLAKHRMTMLRQNLGFVGEDAFIEPPFTVDYGCNLRLGPRFYSNFNLTILDCGFVSIGARAMFGPNVSIFAATHEVSVQSRRDNIEYALPVVIGDDCWIGGHVVILGGVTIGDGVTIGAGSVVTKDIPSWSVAIGAPAKVVKKVEPLEKLPGDETVFQTRERAG